MNTLAVLVPLESDRLVLVDILERFLTNNFNSCTQIEFRRIVTIVLVVDFTQAPRHCEARVSSAPGGPLARCRTRGGTAGSIEARALSR